MWEDQDHIFISDPCEYSKFGDYLNDDIDIIIGNPSKNAQINKGWHYMPRLIVIPLVSGLQLRIIVIQINYETKDVVVVWDDPKGNFPEHLKQSLLESVKFNILRLF